METQYPLTDFVEFSPAELQQRAGDHLALMQRRHTIRSFSDKPVPRQVIEQLIQVAASAPSGANHQPWRAGNTGHPHISREIPDIHTLEIPDIDRLLGIPDTGIPDIHRLPHPP